MFISNLIAIFEKYFLYKAHTPEHQMDFLQHQLADIIDFATLRGILKYNQRGKLVHAPIALKPFSIPSSVLRRIQRQTPVFNQLMLEVSKDREFLLEHLIPVAQTDPFTQTLLSIQSNEVTQLYSMSIARNDYFLSPMPDETLQPKQVEFNTIATSFPFLSTQVCDLHQTLYKNMDIHRQLVPNDPLTRIVQAIAQAVRYYDYPGSQMLMVVQPEEQNIFDQRAIEYYLMRDHGILTLRLPLDVIADQGRIKNGHLMVDEKIIALTYFRSGYAPDDMNSEKSIRGRKLIESSSTIKVPDISMHLAGSKKIQQVLTQYEYLKRFVAGNESGEILSTFVGMHHLDEMVSVENKKCTVAELAIRFPQKYVLKPQREGGGNNFYGLEIPNVLESLTKDQRQAYILMEHIQGVEHHSVLLVNHQISEVSCVSEVGCYGIILADDDNILMNEDAGYLVRTKSSDQNEGGVCAGYACLNSLVFSD